MYSVVLLIFVRLLYMGSKCCGTVIWVIVVAVVGGSSSLCFVTLYRVQILKTWMEQYFSGLGFNETHPAPSPKFCHIFLPSLLGLAP